MVQGHHGKPWISPREQVERLKAKGVRFDFMSEADAERYLSENNNYFRLQSYRDNFAKVETGPREGQFANLDFGMLVDLSVIDMVLRQQMLLLTLDVEHFSRVRLLGEIESHGEDGYRIVSDFIDSYDRVDAGGNVRNATWGEIQRGISSPYVKGVLDRYQRDDMPAWVFMEVTSFGTFCYFRRFCSDRFEISNDQSFYMLMSVKLLRNACAHNNCVLNDLTSGEPMYRPSYEVLGALSTIKGLGKSIRSTKMKNDRVQEIATTLYLHHLLASEGVAIHAGVRLRTLVQRIYKNIGYYSGATQIVTTFDFLGKVIEAWYPQE